MPTICVSKLLNKLPKKPDVYPHTITTKPGNLQADITYVFNFSSKTGGYDYILCVIDIYSRFLWTFPLKVISKAKVEHEISAIITNLHESKWNSPTITSLSLRTRVLISVERSKKEQLPRRVRSHSNVGTSPSPRHFAIDSESYGKTGTAVGVNHCGRTSLHCGEVCLNQHWKEECT
jgi:hypothetical protein